MKRILVALLLPLALQAQVTPRDSIITVTANRTSVLTPDRVATWVLVEGTGETPADANTRLETKLKAVNDAIRGLGSSASADKPMSYGVALAQNPNGYPVPASPASYVSRTVIRLQLNRIDQMSSAIAAILAAGATSAGSPMFESSTLDAARREKIAEAVAVARADAEALASALGGKLGALVDVSSSGNPVNFGQNSQIYFDARYSGSQVAAPAVMLNTNVTVRFRLVR